jgi:membrane protease YdiL (CAAX protease family)
MSRSQVRPGIWAPAGVACSLGVVFSVLVRSGRLGPLDFWWGMALAIAFATSLALVTDRGYAPRLREDLARGSWRKVGLGLASAAVLYGVFAAGRAVSLRVFPFAGAGIDSVYALKSGVGPLRVVLLLALVIGPGEELVWRGFLQENAQKRFGRLAGFVVTAIFYTAVHVASGNVMLILAAGVCGVFWGWMYTAWRSPLLNAVSHTLWDLLVFVLFPL